MSNYRWLIIFLAFGFMPSPAFPEQPHRILILYQGDFTNPFFIKHAEAIRAALTADTSKPLEIYQENLDMERFPSQDFQHKMAKWLEEKYGDRGIDVIITEGPEALNFALQARSQRNESIPIVFTAIGDYYVRRLALPRNVTGISSISSIKDSVQLAFNMIPDTKRVVVLGDMGNASSHLWDISSDLTQLQMKQEVNVMIDMPIATLLQRISSLPKNTTILYLGIVTDVGTGQYFLPNELLTAFAKSANRPIFVTTDSLLGYGAVGGLIWESEEGAREIAGITHRILNGEDASTIPVEYVDNRKLIFDSRVLKRWSIGEDQAPLGSRLINRDPTLWELYSYQIVIVISVVVLQTVLIVALIIEYRRRRKAEWRFRHSMSDLAHLSRSSALGELSASIAHELNQPLAAILSNAQAANRLIRSSPPAISEASDVLADICDDSQNAGDIIRSMRSLFRKKEFLPVAVDINKVIDEMLRFVRWEARSKNVAIDIALERNLPLVAGDEVQLKQVILNLALNAIAAAHGATAEGRVTIATGSPKNDAVELSVEDNGPGIPVESFDQIFNPYYTTKDYGMGMGLSISRTIIEAHGGRLNARNIEGKDGTIQGARFDFMLAAMKKK